ncbi:MAG: hypothetical protein SFT81_07615 [Candidatus Caenarcaniphilales bacterium]|nr:hypothetical protein [Candidatus Caenarcaniphilales bacterium]
MKNKLCFLLSSLLLAACIAAELLAADTKVGLPVSPKNQITGCQNEISLAQLVGKPDEWLSKDVCFKGTFNSFSALALDYPPALRPQKDFISLTLLRPDTEIPLSELKLAINLEGAQKHEKLPKIAPGDLIAIHGKVFSSALGEPWVDIEQIEVTKIASSKDTTNTDLVSEIDENE